jgi:uncharacterized protein (TIGR02145 family)
MLLNCKKDEQPSKRYYLIVNTLEQSETSHNAITVSGSIISIGEDTAITSGVCWSTNPNPTIADSKTNDGARIGNFSTKITGLAETTKYYVRAYATDSERTYYGEEKVFSTSYELNGSVVFNPDITYGTMTDIDGNVYKTVTIGTQTWMAENLKVTKYNDGTPISSNFGEYCSYNNDESYVKIYGRLYNRFAVKSGKLSPTGWHIPNNDEWTTLLLNVGRNGGARLKESGQRHWIYNMTYNLTADEPNKSGFTALPGGFTDYGFGGINEYCFIWSTTTTYGKQFEMACYLYLTGSNDASIAHDKLVDVFMGSVRCIKD